MSRNLWPEVKPLLDRVLDLAPEKRARFLEIHCGDDAELRREVERFLDLEDQVDEIGDEPFFDLIAGRPPEYRAGQRIGDYELEEEIARGGMGVVYRARRVEGGFDETVAIKILKRGFDTASFVRRFRTEQQILANLDHPNIVRMLAGGATGDGLPYLVMEAVEGTRLDQYCDEKLPALPARLDLFLKICDAVHRAHNHMVVHCDLKPSNILVTAAGEPKLLDFGIAKVLHQGADGIDHSLSRRLGTPPFASPQQATGDPITTANDVFSLGALLFFLLTGRQPVPVETRESQPQVPSRVLGDLPAEPPATEPSKAAGDAAPASHPIPREQVRGDLDAITLMAMAWDPAERYDSAAALAADIRRHRDELPVAAQPYSWSYVLGRALRRWRKRLLVGGIVSFGLLFATAAAIVAQVQARFQATRAQELRAAYLEMLEVYDPTSDESRADAVRTAVDKLFATDRFYDRADRALLYDRLGRLLYRLQSLPQARRLLEAALELREQGRPPDPKALAASLNNLALVHKAQGEIEIARRLFDRSAAIHARHPDLDPHAFADLQANLAAIHADVEDHPTAERFYRAALESTRRLYGPSDTHVATVANNYGSFLLRTGRPREAQPLLVEALKVNESILGSDHPKLAAPLINLGALRERLGDQEGSIAAYRRAVAIRAEHLGPRNPATARAKNGLGFALLGRGGPGDLQEAQHLLVSAKETLDANLGESHLTSLVVGRNLAAVRLAQGDADQAGELMGRVAELFEQAATAPRWRVADARSLLGACFLAQGKLEAARPLLEGAAERIADEQGEDFRAAREAAQRWSAWLARSAETAAATSP